MKTGIQVSSLKPLLGSEAAVREAFRRIRTLTDAVQIQWVDPSVSPQVIGRAVRENRLESLGVQDFYLLVRENLEYYVSLNQETGGSWLCVSRIPEEFKSEAGLGQFRDELHQLQEKLDIFGQRLCFHPVSGDFQAVPGMDAVAWLLEAMPELAICPDLYHLNKNCADMPGFLRKYRGRVCMVHFKDGIGDTLVPAGQGDTNWQGVIRACLETGVPYGLAEQERWQGDPYDALNQALTWIHGEIRKETGENFP